MSHEIWEDRFVAVRVPAWHGIGQVFQEEISASKAAEEANLLYAVGKYPLAARVGSRYVNSGLVIIGREEGDQLESFGVAKEFEITMLADIMEELDVLAARYPLSSAGAMRKGAEVFFTFEISGESDIVGEEYREYLAVLHSYRPGVSHKVMYTPVRVVCNNTLVMAESSAKSRLTVSHAAGATERLSAAYAITDALAQAASVKRVLKLMSQKKLSEAKADEVLARIYGRYKPKDKLDEAIIERVSEEVVRTYAPQRPSQVRYHDRMIEMARKAYEIFNDEHPQLSGTAYAMYQAVVEIADHRKARGEDGPYESALIGTRAQEKQVAWKVLANISS